MPTDLICPECGNVLEWQQYSSDGIGNAHCSANMSFVRLDRRLEPCYWTGFVIRVSDEQIRLATDEEVAEIKKQPSAF